MNDARQPWHRLENLFEVIELPATQSPVRLAIAMPSGALRRLPGFPSAALPESGRVASGRGLTAETCRASALGEAAELVSCCAWGDEPLVRATEAELGPAAISPELLTGWSEAQIDEREEWNACHGSFDWRPRRRDPRNPIDWIAVDNAHGGPPAYVPADFAFIGRRHGEDALCVGDSSGCAAGMTNEEAKLAAILELVERDATALWWYGGGRSGLVDLMTIPREKELLVWLADRPRRTRLFDITTDLGIPVFAAASAEQDGRDVVFGFAAHLDSPSSAIAALTEMVQMEFSLTSARALGTAAADWAEWRNKVSLTTPPLDRALYHTPQPIASCEVKGFKGVLNALARKGVDLYLADMIRPTMGIPAYRAISSVLCNCKPRFARKRLMAKVSTEHRLKSRPLLVI
jgi:ribosomal protein S12 methylthiotransferase accessory factor